LSLITQTLDALRCDADAVLTFKTSMDDQCMGTDVSLIATVYGSWHILASLHGRKFQLCGLNAVSTAAWWMI